MSVFDVVTTYYLRPVYDRAKSFYEKAVVEEMADGSKLLYSYGTLVAGVDKENNIHKYWDDYSATTMRHINEFLQQCGLDKVTKTEWGFFRAEYK